LLKKHFDFKGFLLNVVVLLVYLSISIKSVK